MKRFDFPPPNRRLRKKASPAYRSVYPSHYRLYIRSTLIMQPLPVKNTEKTKSPSAWHDKSSFARCGCLLTALFFMPPPPNGCPLPSQTHLGGFSSRFMRPGASRIVPILLREPVRSGLCRRRITAARTNKRSNWRARTLLLSGGARSIGRFTCYIVGESAKLAAGLKKRRPKNTRLSRENRPTILLSIFTESNRCSNCCRKASPR